jgi:hypothetical protein
MKPLQRGLDPEESRGECCLAWQSAMRLGRRARGYVPRERRRRLRRDSGLPDDTRW